MRLVPSFPAGMALRPAPVRISLATCLELRVGQLMTRRHPPVALPYKSQEVSQVAYMLDVVVYGSELCFVLHPHLMLLFGPGAGGRKPVPQNPITDRQYWWQTFDSISEPMTDNASFCTLPGR